MLLCVVYRQPNANYPFWDKFQQSMENATDYSSNVITGDLNVDFFSEQFHKLFDEDIHSLQVSKSAFRESQTNLLYVLVDLRWTFM
jgi:hypothetical protein